VPEIDDRASLQDLDGIRVDVEALPPLVVKQGLSAERLKADVEGQLRHAGLRILPMGEFLTGDPHLQVVVRVSDVQGSAVASQVELNFVQIVFMRRNPAVTFNRARTWNATARVSLGPAAQLADRVRGETTRQVEQFIADYRQANR